MRKFINKLYKLHHRTRLEKVKTRITDKCKIWELIFTSLVFVLQLRQVGVCSVNQYYLGKGVPALMTSRLREGETNPETNFT